MRINWLPDDVQVEITMSNDRPPEGFDREGNAWRVVVTVDGQDGSVTLPFYTGSLAGEPTPESVFECVALDASVTDYACFEEWAENMGLNPDSRKDEATYNACREQTRRLRALLGENRWEVIRDFALDA